VTRPARPEGEGEGAELGPGAKGELDAIGLPGERLIVGGGGAF